MKQTAVEFFAEELNNWRVREFGELAIIGIPSEVFEQAKEMEKEQIKDAYWDGGQDIPIHGRQCEQYYNETFKLE